MNETKNLIRSETEACLAFRRLQLITYEYNDFYCFMQQYHTVIILVLATSAYYGSIKFVNEIAVLVYLIFPLSAMASTFVTNLIYPFKALVPRSSEEFKSSWQNSMENSLEFRTFLTSCPELRITSGSFFSYTRSSSLTFTQINMDNTINLLIA